MTLSQMPKQANHHVNAGKKDVISARQPLSWPIKERAGLSLQDGHRRGTSLRKQTKLWENFKTIVFMANHSQQQVIDRIQVFSWLVAAVAVNRHL